MEMMPSAEHDEITATVAAFLADRLPVTGRGHDHVSTAPEITDDVWRECAELGWLSLGLPEEAGGVGYGLVEEVILFQELGRGVAPGPFLPGVLGAHLAAAAGRTDIAGEIASGATKVALGTPVGAAVIGASVSADLSIVHAGDAALVLVCDGAGGALVPTSSIEVAPVDPVDGSIVIARGRAADVAAIAHIESSVESIHQRGLVLAAAAASGLADAVLTLAVAYAGERVQFGKPIGAYQAIKHRCADMKVSADGAAAQTAYAAICVRDGLEGAATEAAIAKYVADEAARRNAEGAVQIHGAMGFTSEALPHRYVYRAHVLARCLASRPQLLDRIVPRESAL